MRPELELMREWYAYNSYVRKRYYRVLAKLPETELNRDRGASFPSLLDMFIHTLDAYGIGLSSSILTDFTNTIG